MRIGIRLAITSLVLASIIVSAIGVHLLWWRTAEGNSQALAATINEQIVSAVGKELETITTQARAAHTAIRTLFVQNVLETREADKREFVFLSQLQAQPGIQSRTRYCCPIMHCTRSFRYRIKPVPLSEASTGGAEASCSN